MYIYLIQVASRMDSTSLPGEIQCTQEVVDSLQGSHFQFRFVINFFRNFIFSSVMIFCHIFIDITDAEVKSKSKEKAIWLRIF